MIKEIYCIQLVHKAQGHTRSISKHKEQMKAQKLN